MNPKEKTTSNLFDASLVGKSRSGFRLPINTHVNTNVNTHVNAHNLSAPHTSSNQAHLQHTQVQASAAKASSGHGVGSVNLVLVSQSRVHSDVPGSAGPASEGGSDVSNSASISASNHKSSFYTVDLQSVQSSQSIQSKSEAKGQDFLIELMRMCYIFGFCDIMLMLGSLSNLGGRLAVNLSIMSSLPILISAMVIHCFIKDKRRMILLPLAANCLLCYGCVYNIVGISPIPILAHIPGILLLSIFFSAICNGTRRIVNLILMMLICICIAGNAVFSMAEDRNFMIVSFSCIMGLLFLQSNIGNVYCGTGCASMCSGDILRITKNDV